MRRLVWPVAAMAVAACGIISPRPSVPGVPPTAIGPQRHECGNLAPDDCEAAIAQVIVQIPDEARSPIAVAATLDPNGPTQRGGDWVVLVAFAPVGDTDNWMNPPTWIVTRRMFSSELKVEPWRTGTLPDHFLALLRTAGIAG